MTEESRAAGQAATVLLHHIRRMGSGPMTHSEHARGLHLAERARRWLTDGREGRPLGESGTQPAAAYEPAAEGAYESVVDFRADGRNRGSLDPVRVNGRIVERRRSPTREEAARWGRGGRPATLRR